MRHDPMQDIFIDEAESVPNKGARLKPVALVARWSGVAVSLILLGGAAYWAYELGRRDAREVPVIRAMEGPMREVAATPGGEVAENQGLAVNRVLEGTRAEPETSPALAPPPAELSEEDTAAAAPRPPARPEESTAEPGEVQLTLGPEAEAEPEPESPALTLPALVRPARRPEGLGASTDTIVAEAVNAEAAEQAGFLEPADIPKGTRMVQLGAFDTREQAEAEWTKIISRIGSLLSEKRPLIEIAETNGRSFYRLRAVGYDDVEAARSACAAIVARDLLCVPVTAR